MSHGSWLYSRVRAVSLLQSKWWGYLVKPWRLINILGHELVSDAWSIMFHWLTFMSKTLKCNRVDSVIIRRGQKVQFPSFSSVWSANCDLCMNRIYLLIECASEEALESVANTGGHMILLLDGYRDRVGTIFIERAKKQYWGPSPHELLSLSILNKDSTRITIFRLQWLCGPLLLSCHSQI